MFSKLKTKLSKDSTCTATQELDTQSTISSKQSTEQSTQQSIEEDTKPNSKHKDEDAKTHVYAAHAFCLKG